MGVFQRKVAVSMWHSMILLLLEVRECKTKLSASEILYDNSNERPCLLVCQPPHWNAPPSISPTSWMLLLCESSSWLRPHAYCTWSSSNTIAKYPENTKSKLSLTCVARDMDKYRDLEIHTELQEKNKMLSRPETYCEYANITVSGTQALPFSTCLTSSFSLHHAPLPSVSSHLLIFSQTSIFKNMVSPLKNKKNMVPQILLPGITYDAASESWGTKCIKEAAFKFSYKGYRKWILSILSWTLFILG